MKVELISIDSLESKVQTVGVWFDLLSEAYEFGKEEGHHFVDMREENRDYKFRNAMELYLSKKFDLRARDVAQVPRVLLKQLMEGFYHGISEQTLANYRTYMSSIRKYAESHHIA